MSERYEQAVNERLSDRFGDVESSGLASVLMETAKNAVEDNLQDYMPQLKSCTQESLLEELDEYNIEVIYRPVSYTHLDVYKRQAMLFPKARQLLLNGKRLQAAALRTFSKSSM